MKDEADKRAEEEDKPEQKLPDSSHERVIEGEAEREEPKQKS